MKGVIAIGMTLLAGAACNFKMCSYNISINFQLGSKGCDYQCGNHVSCFGSTYEGTRGHLACTLTMKTRQGSEDSCPPGHHSRRLTTRSGHKDTVPVQNKNAVAADDMAKYLLSIAKLSIAGKGPGYCSPTKDGNNILSSSTQCIVAFAQPIVKQQISVLKIILFTSSYQYFRVILFVQPEHMSAKNATRGVVLTSEQPLKEVDVTPCDQHSVVMGKLRLTQIKSHSDMSLVLSFDPIKGYFFVIQDDVIVAVTQTERSSQRFHIAIFGRGETLTSTKGCTAMKCVNPTVIRKAIGVAARLSDVRGNATPSSDCQSAQKYKLTW